MRCIDITSSGIGRIWPPYRSPRFDRAAHYTWRGLFFDAKGREIVPGQPLDPRDQGPHEIIRPHHLARVSRLLAQADTIPPGRFRSEAIAILGPDCPPGRPQIERQLRALLQPSAEPVDGGEPRAGA